MEKNGTQDRRVRYTKLVLRQSLLELMRDRPINKINVTDICERADINRGTFYAHYADQYDLLAQIENELYEEIKRSIEKSLNADTLSSLLVEIFEALAANGDLCRILLSEFGDKAFLKRIVDIARDKCIEEWSALIPSADRRVLDMHYTFDANGSVGVIQEWVQNGLAETPGEIARLLDRISKGVLRAFIEPEGAGRA